MKPMSIHPNNGDVISSSTAVSALLVKLFQHPFNLPGGSLVPDLPTQSLHTQGLRFGQGDTQQEN